MAQNNVLPTVVEWTGDSLRLLDQTRLPGVCEFLTLHTVEGVCAAILRLSVRGAPAIGVAAAWGLLLAYDEATANHSDPTAAVKAAALRLKSVRPTAVNLAWAIDRSLRQGSAGGSLSRAALETAASQLQTEETAACERIGDAGLELIAEGMGVMTHCNAGAMATTGIGTATAPLYKAQAAGIGFRVWVNETRPLLQGGRITAWELSRSGIDTVLATDSMAASVMRDGNIACVITGADRVAANGDAANKIGTLGLAVIAAHYGIPFYIACPISTIDAGTAEGSGILIEHRDAGEVRDLAGHAVNYRGCDVYNPAFDVTPRALIQGYITDRGLITPPFNQSPLGALS